MPKRGSFPRAILGLAAFGGRCECLFEEGDRKEAVTDSSYIFLK